MRKTSMMLAAAAAFDLGVMVTGGHAAEGNGQEFMKVTTKTASPGTQNDYLKIKFTDVLVSSLKVSGMSGEMACMDKGGSLITKGGQAYCHLPSSSPTQK